MHDYELYSKKYSSYNVVFNPASNAAGNRNNLMTVLEDGEQAVFLDDDIKSIKKVRIINKKAKSFDLANPKEFNSFIDYGFRTARGGVWGIQFTTHTLKLRDGIIRGRYYKNVLLDGSFMGFTKGCIRFNESLTIGEDYEAIINSIVSGTDVFKLTGFVINKPMNGTNRGGYNKEYQKGKRYWHNQLKRIVDEYPGIVSFTKKDPLCTALKIKVKL